MLFTLKIPASAKTQARGPDVLCSCRNEAPGAPRSVDEAVEPLWSSVCVREWALPPAWSPARVRAGFEDPGGGGEEF